MMQKIGMALLAIGLLAGCGTNNVTQDKQIADIYEKAGVTGTFGMFDNAQGQFTVHNLTRFRDSAYLPASTFKIFNALAALGTGVIFSDTVVVPWDGTARRPEWDKDMDMREAFKVSNVPFFQAMARRIGADTLQLLIDSIGYGRRYDTFRIAGNVDTFWLDNSLRITADEQLGFVKKLYFRQLPFQNREQELVRSMMMQEQTDKYQLAYKTGLGTLPNGKEITWIVGWIEENRHVYPFVLNMEAKAAGTNLVQARMQVLRSTLEYLGFFRGLK